MAGTMYTSTHGESERVFVWSLATICAILYNSLCVAVVVFDMVKRKTTSNDCIIRKRPGQRKTNDCVIRKNPGPRETNPGYNTSVFYLGEPVDFVV